MAHIAKVKKVYEYNDLGEGEVLLKIEGLEIKCETSDIFIEETHCIVNLSIKHAEIIKICPHKICYEVMESSNCMTILKGIIMKSLNKREFIIESLLEIRVSSDKDIDIELSTGDFIEVKGILHVNLII
ncbi:MAG TPA: hypothetical protein PL110_11955 [Candidatus Eremiobacteraeota bacterium]|nr:MAG: hypothetical protein BWY64_02808 [bacterium ADurb.Bin363]HPZ08823.1 hypothetical protein [Candidatus Eremiobacteraeota bacterium]